MCGIAGIVSWGAPRDTTSIVGSMRDALHHRGPDDSGVERIHAAGPEVVFGHTRLAIIDLSPAGHQPMRDADAGNWITFNGEIYNFLELRAELETAGQRFRSRSDTEVILKAFAAWGTAAWPRLRGIFAFALWDARQRRVHLVRDQLGVKPLYVARPAGALVFASEVRSVLASGLVERRICDDGLVSFLAHGSVQEPFTLVEGVRSIPPGGWMEIAESGETREGTYWAMPAVSPIPGDRDEEQLLAGVRRTLVDAVRHQMIADVPVGVFLSGGIDSVALAYLAQHSTGAQVRTFSLVFREPRYDERVFSRLAAQRLGTAHTEVEFSVDDVRRSIGAALAAFDQPSMDGTNTFFVSQATRQAGLKVALSGVGGDEFFGGYRGYRKARLLHRLEALRPWPRAVRQLLPAALRLARRGGMAARLGEFLDSTEPASHAARRLFLDREISGLAPAAGAGRGWAGPARQWFEAELAGHDAINRFALREARGYMTSTLLRDTDQMTMAHALEVRVPLVDQGVVEHLMRLPGRTRLRRGQPKPLLTLPLRGDIPDECVFRRKANFELPYSVWLKNELRDQVAANLASSGSPLAGVLEPDTVAGIWRGFLDGRIYWTRVWSLNVLAHWLGANRITR